MNALDQLGVPGLMVATTEFTVAAASQAKSLGFHPNIVWVEHPIQNRTKEELIAIADTAFTPILATLSGNA
ncbi:MAG: hypothetical protein OEU46_02525 [Alphaproteobacteria bacterium]|nr:hypothetical protein [Alphaproteobacteria bacterium]